MSIAVIGGGPAGMMAAYAAAQNGHAVSLFEKNEKLDKKLYLTGKGRCNVTNTADRDAFFANITRNPRFLYSAFSAFDNQDMIRLIEEAGVPLKQERGGRVFPASDKSSDILSAMERLVRGAGVRVLLRTEVTGIAAQDGHVCGVTTQAGFLPFDAVVVATGGVSYPSTGSTGDGYRFAEALGHDVIAPTPSLIPFETVEDWPNALTGLTLKNVTLTAEQDGRRTVSEPGELLLTHFGVSGPLVLTLSTLLSGDPAGTRLFIDLKPALTREQLDARLLRDLAGSGKKQLRTALSGLLPAKLLDTVLSLAGIDPFMPASEFTKAQRAALTEINKALPLTVRCARPIEEAIVTRGGVSVRSVNASTMGSRLVEGLYFAGEVLDVDAKTGGFNLQIAWSTGALAGQSIG